MYHFYLSWKNVTTSESFKFSDVNEELSQIKEFLEYNPNAPIPISKNAEKKPWEKERRVKLFDMVKKEEKFTNIYNKGLIQNYIEILFPPSLYKKQSKFKK